MVEKHSNPFAQFLENRAKGSFENHYHVVFISQSGYTQLSRLDVDIVQSGWRTEELAEKWIAKHFESGYTSEHIMPATVLCPLEDRCSRTINEVSCCKNCETIESVYNPAPDPSEFATLTDGNDSEMLYRMGTELGEHS